MRLKSYFSESVEAAMELARKELGDDALLVHARPATPETRYLGAYEVVFGVVPPEPPAPGLIPATHQETLSVDSELGRFVALVGPPGAGKTTTLVKLAVRCGLAQGRSVQIITTDVHRIAAADQLRTLAAILGVGCDVVQTPLAMLQSMQEHRAKNLILIDTPGYSFRNLDEASDLAQCLANDPEVDTHLVLPASMKPGDLARMADAYRMFKPAKLLFTRVDETENLSSLGKEAMRLNLPVSFLSAGQEIPDDIEEATPAAFMKATPSLYALPHTMGAAA